MIEIDFLENARPIYPAKPLEINYKTWGKNAISNGKTDVIESMNRDL